MCASASPCGVTVDAFPDLRLHGHVDSWSPGTGSTFALLAPDNATGNFTKVVQRVPVKIVLDPESRPGHAGAARHVRRGDDRYRVPPKPRQSRGSLEPAPAPGDRGRDRRCTASRTCIRPRLHPVSRDLRPYVGTRRRAARLDPGGAREPRITTFGLADLRGGLHAGFDEGAWITTSFGVGQMLVGVASPYLGAVFGVAPRAAAWHRAVLHDLPCSPRLPPSLNGFLMLQLLAGIGSGTFIPLTISFVVRSLPARLVVYGIAIYAMNSELSQNVAASLEGWYADHLSWHWIYWQYCVALPLMFACIWYGVPREAHQHRSAARSRLAGPRLRGPRLRHALRRARPGQPARLERAAAWSSACWSRGAILTVAFILRELVTPRPFLNLRLLLRGNLLILMLLLSGFRFIILSTAYIIPTYLQTVQNFRELQVGAVLLWIALPQLVIALPLAALLRRVDGRACAGPWRGADRHRLPDGEQPDQPMGHGRFPAVANPAGGRPVVRADRPHHADRRASIIPAEALTIGCLLQTSRLFGGEIGTAFMQTFVRVREQVFQSDRPARR